MSQKPSNSSTRGNEPTTPASLKQLASKIQFQEYISPHPKPVSFGNLEIPIPDKIEYMYENGCNVTPHSIAKNSATEGNDTLQKLQSTIPEPPPAVSPLSHGTTHGNEYEHETMDDRDAAMTFDEAAHKFQLKPKSSNQMISHPQTNATTSTPPRPLPHDIDTMSMSAAPPTPNHIMGIDEHPSLEVTHTSDAHSTLASVAVPASTAVPVASAVAEPPKVDKKEYERIQKALDVTVEAYSAMKHIAKQQEQEMSQMRAAMDSLQNANQRLTTAAAATATTDTVTAAAPSVTGVARQKDDHVPTPKVTIQSILKPSKSIEIDENRSVTFSNSVVILTDDAQPRRTCPTSEKKALLRTSRPPTPHPKFKSIPQPRQSLRTQSTATTQGNNHGSPLAPKQRRKIPKPQHHTPKQLTPPRLMTPAKIHYMPVKDTDKTPPCKEKLRYALTPGPLDGAPATKFASRLQSRVNSTTITSGITSGITSFGNAYENTSSGVSFGSQSSRLSSNTSIDLSSRPDYRTDSGVDSGTAFGGQRSPSGTPHFSRVNSKLDDVLNMAKGIEARQNAKYGSENVNPMVPRPSYSSLYSSQKSTYSTSTQDTSMRSDKGFLSALMPKSDISNRENTGVSSIATIASQMAENVSTAVSAIAKAKMRTAAIEAQLSNQSQKHNSAEERMPFGEISSTPLQQLSNHRSNNNNNGSLSKPGRGASQPLQSLSPLQPSVDKRSDDMSELKSIFNEMSIFDRKQSQNSNNATFDLNVQ